MKKITVLILTLLLMVPLIACGDNKPATTTAPPAVTETEAAVTTPAGEKTFTLDELAAFNGKDGNRAYVAVDGVVYDLTDSAAWKNGQHNGFEAGKDLTDEIKNVSPHGVGNLEGIPVVGKLVD